MYADALEYKMNPDIRRSLKPVRVEDSVYSILNTLKMPDGETIGGICFLIFFGFMAYTAIDAAFIHPGHFVDTGNCNNTSNNSSCEDMGYDTGYASRYGGIAAGAL